MTERQKAATIERMKVAPNVGLIEMAADAINRAPETKAERFIRESQRKELRSLGNARAQLIGASGLTEDFQLGYELGVETARMWLRGNPGAVTAGVEF